MPKSFALVANAVNVPLLVRVLFTNSEIIIQIHLRPKRRFHVGGSAVAAITTFWSGRCVASHNLADRHDKGAIGKTGDIIGVNDRQHALGKCEQPVVNLRS